MADDGSLSDILIAVDLWAEGLSRGHHRRLSRHRRADPALVHPVRHSLDLISWKDRKAVVPELRAIRPSPRTPMAGLAAIEAFEAGPWGAKPPAVAPARRRNRDLRHRVPRAFPWAVRRIVCTTDAIEALNPKLRRAGPGTRARPP